MTNEFSPTSSDGVVAIVLAAGTSSRMGGIHKIWADLDGAPLIARPLRALAATPGVEVVVAVAPRERHAAIVALLDGCNVQVRCVEGGARRQDSVAAGIAAAPDAAWYLVHDGARALVTPALATLTLEAARAHGAAVPGVPIADTVKRVQPGNPGGREGERVLGTIERGPLRAIQTPQAFRGDLLRRAHAEVTNDATDDASMLEHLDLTVVVVAGDATNMKVTTPADLEVARVLLAQRERGD
ncbi:MAG: 2-C-methyl-D-erythritol 4-phosphate cytidylyltransferase [Chloroflexota bacterium]